MFQSLNTVLGGEARSHASSRVRTSNKLYFHGRVGS